MNKFLKSNEHIIRIASNLIFTAVFIVFITFSVMKVLERDKQHEINMTELKQEREKQKELLIKSDLLYDEMLEYYKELKEASK